MATPNLLVTNELIPDVIDAARQDYNVTEAYGVPPQALGEVLGQYDALLCRSATKVTREVIGHAVPGSLEIIASATSGMDHIDIQAATEANVTVCHTPFTVTRANAEYNIGTIITLSRNILSATAQMKNGQWDQQTILGHEIGGRTLGLVGFGRIGRQTAQFGTALGMRAHAYDPYVPDVVFTEQGVPRASLDELMRKSDFVVVNVPRTPETTGMLGVRELSLMKAGSYIVQVARGGVVDEKALLAALSEKRIAGAAIDVFDHEPEIDERFRAVAEEHGNIILTPHVGCSTQETRRRAGMCALGELNRYFSNEPLQFQVVTSRSISGKPLNLPPQNMLT